MAESNEQIILGQTDGTPDGGRLRSVIDGDPRIRALIGRLTPDQARALGGILSDPEKLKGVISSPQAKSFMKKQRVQGGFDGGGNGNI